ncbi:hypothetical protein WR25_26052 isoform B [Diploscapter pachys]|uniref:Uncharacterized protein n=1 Tax=Diploscapter pachys TaxID=2018661 RepID=A0A2A2KR62_9BILA|nr:hypothetical protein WR25_26052 isoform B [Diploscapter pachys]
MSKKRLAFTIKNQSLEVFSQPSPAKHSDMRPSQYPTFYPQYSNEFQSKQRTSSSMGIGMGVAMVMQQAGALVGAPQAAFDVNSLHAQIRKAKAEGRTVTMVNGSLYFDYQLVARIPSNVDLRV